MAVGCDLWPHCPWCGPGRRCLRVVLGVGAPQHFIAGPRPATAAVCDGCARGSGCACPPWETVVVPGSRGRAVSAVLVVRVMKSWRSSRRC